MVKANAAFILRVLVGLHVVVGLLVLVAWLRPMDLSSEAAAYRAVLWDMTSGLSVWSGIGNLSSLIGGSLHVIALSAVIFRRKFGMYLLLISPVFMVVFFWLSLPEFLSPDAYPQLDKPDLDLLLTMAGASWGAIVAFGLSNASDIFRMDSQLEIASKHVLNH